MDAENLSDKSHKDNRGDIVPFRSFVPLPPSEILQAYENIYPGATRILFGELEKQAEHRRKIEDRSIDNDGKRANRGLIFGFIISLSLIFSGTTMVLTNHDWVGATIIVSACASLAGIFVYGSASRRNERTEKRMLLAEQQVSRRFLPNGSEDTEIAKVRQKAKELDRPPESDS